MIDFDEDDEDFDESFDQNFDQRFDDIIEVLDEETNFDMDNTNTDNFEFVEINMKLPFQIRCA